MNQKNIFSVISILLLLQGIGFFFMKSQIMASAFPAVDATGQEALSHFMEVVSALSILLGLITWAIRTTPGVVWAYVIGFLILLAISLNHKFLEGINVPIPALAIQAIILLGCVYLWLQKK